MLFPWQPDLCSLISVLNLYKIDISTHRLLQAVNYLKELQQSIPWGISIIGNLMYCVSEGDDYPGQSLKNDIHDIGYLLAKLMDVISFTSKQIDLFDTKLSSKGDK